MSDDTIIKGKPKRILRFLVSILKLIPRPWAVVASRVGDAAENAGLFQNKSGPKF